MQYKQKRQSMYQQIQPKHQYRQEMDQYGESNRQHHQWSLKQLSQTPIDQIMILLQQKQLLVKQLCKQITKHKSSQVKSQKLISSLQQKIQKLSPNNNNTNNKFMMPSEFKNLFIQFMNTTVTNLFGQLLDRPILYSLLLKKILYKAYQVIKQTINHKIKQILTILNGNQNVIDQKEVEEIKCYLLPYLQNHYAQILPLIFNEQSNQNKSAKLIHIQFSNDQAIIQQLMNFQNDQLQDQLKLFFKQLYQICVYMILQQRPWQFQFQFNQQNNLNQQDQHSNRQNQTNLIQNDQKNPNQIHKYVKKQYTCIDGFVKQGNQVIALLKGLKKKQKQTYQYHPNIKNFVIPYHFDQDQQQIIDFNVKIIFFKSKQRIDMPAKQIQKQKQMQNKNISLHQQLQLEYESYLNKQIQKNPKSLNKQKPNSAKIITDKSQMTEYQLNLNKKLIVDTNSYKRKQKSHKNSYQNQNKQNINQNISQKNNNKNKLISNSKKNYISVQKTNLKKIKKQKSNSVIDLAANKGKLIHVSHNDEYTDHLKQVKCQDLPFSRQLIKKNKKNIPKTSRKQSVGKIISQQSHLTSSNLQQKPLSHYNTILLKKQTIHTQHKDQKGLLSATKIKKKNSIKPKEEKSINLDVKQNNQEKQQSHKEKQQSYKEKQQSYKENRPLTIRTYQNGLVSKLRDKYLFA